MKSLIIKSSLQILASSEIIFEAIVDPGKMSHYFISESNGRMEGGKQLEWKFPEFEGSFPVTVLQTQKNALISFQWEGSEDHQTTVEIKLESRTEFKTVIHIIESEMPVNDEGLAWYGRNTGGWANFLASLKAYVEHGINLRKGAFNFMN